MFSTFELTVRLNGKIGKVKMSRNDIGTCKDCPQAISNGDANFHCSFFSDPIFSAAPQINQFIAINFKENKFGEFHR